MNAPGMSHWLTGLYIKVRDHAWHYIQQSSADSINDYSYILRSLTSGRDGVSSGISVSNLTATLSSTLTQEGG